MNRSTKDLIDDYLYSITATQDFSDNQPFTAAAISAQLHVSRSLASKYLNELAKEGKVIKVSSRPVYFFHRKKMEEKYTSKFQEDDFYDLEEVKQFVKDHYQQSKGFENIVGYDLSLAKTIKRFSEAFEYPPCGLPILLYGQRGTGKSLLTDTIIKNAIQKGKVSSHAKVMRFEVSDTNSDEIQCELKQTLQKEYRLDQAEEMILVFRHAQYLSESLQEYIGNLLKEMRDYQQVRLRNRILRIILLSEKEMTSWMSESLMKYIVLSLYCSSFQEKSVEEKEELVMRFIQSEAQKIDGKVSLSVMALRALINGEYKQNARTLQSYIKIMFASAIKRGNKEQLQIQIVDLPEELLKTLPVTAQENGGYLNLDTYHRNSKIEYILNYFDQILHVFDTKDDIEKVMENAKKNIDLLNDHLSYKQKILGSEVKNIEVLVSNLLDLLSRHRYVNLPGNFSTVISRILYLEELYASSVEKWNEKNQKAMDAIYALLQDEVTYAAMTVDEIRHLLQTNLERKVSTFLWIYMAIYINYYNAELPKRKALGIILCHGYSTATSIADATNTMLQSYVFDALDMPLDVTQEEIREELIRHLGRMNKGMDVIVMVDMGSLEILGKDVAASLQCNIGVINNVSTALALNVGSLILQEESIEKILEKVSASSQAKFTAFKKQRKDTILFVSESGLHMAQRMRDFFENSLPKPSALNLEVCDFGELIAQGKNHEVFKFKNILFITGTANPHVDEEVFISLEGIISGSNTQIITQILKDFMNHDQIDDFLNNIRKSFTLQNVVGHLTILNPKILLDDVTSAIDRLQDLLGYQFNGRSLIGIYIHVCCLMERLVTKTQIEKYENLDVFERNNKSFIKCVNESFKEILKRYNVQLPVSEIAYLADFMVYGERKKEVQTNEKK